MYPAEQGKERTERAKKALKDCIDVLEDYFCHCRELFCHETCEYGTLIESMKKQYENMK